MPENGASFDPKTLAAPLRSLLSGCKAFEDADDQLSAARASALKLDMKAWFAPEAANYFGRISKPQILVALQEARNQPPAPAWDKLKKPELAQLAERELAGKGWLPEVLRPAA